MGLCPSLTPSKPVVCLVSDWSSLGFSNSCENELASVVVKAEDGFHVGGRHRLRRRCGLHGGLRLCAERLREDGFLAEFCDGYRPDLHGLRDRRRVGGGGAPGTVF